MATGRNHGKFRLSGEAGTLVAFPSETTATILVTGSSFSKMHMPASAQKPTPRPRISSVFGDEGRLRPLAYLVIFHFCFSLVYIITFARVFTYGKRMVLLHLVLVAGVLSLLVILFTGLALRPTIRTSIRIHVLFSIVSALSFSSLLLLYLADGASNYLWHDNLSYELLIHNISDLSRYLRAVHLNPYWSYLILVVTLLVIFFLYFKLSPRILAGCDQLASALQRSGWWRGRKRPGLIAIVFGLLLAYGSALSILLVKVRGSGRYQGEPIIYFQIGRAHV